MSDPATSRARGIGVRSAAALVAANMIGAGVFTTSGFALGDLGRPEWVLLAWAVGGGIALCGALSYAGLAREMPGNGGEYLFLSRALHPLAGFLAGWVSLFAGFTAPIAVAAHGFEAYLGSTLGVVLPDRVLGATAILVCGFLHGRARRAGVQIQDVAVAVKLAAIGCFIVLGAVALVGAPADASLVRAPVAPGAFPVPAFAVTLVWISFAYSGWNAAVYVAGELDRPDYTLPRALGVATLGVTIVYLGLNAVFVYAAPVETLAGQPEVGAIAAEALGGAGARIALTAVVALGLLTSISAMIMVGPRVYAQMAADGLLPRALAADGEEMPRVAIGLQVGLALAAFFVAGIRELLDYVGFLLGLSAAATVACLFLPGLRARAAASVPGFPVVPLLFVAMTLGSSAFLVRREPLEAAIGLSTLLGGVAVYAFMRRRPGGTRQASRTSRTTSSP